MNDTWTHAMARAVVRPLIGTGVTPNHLTTARLVSGIAACVGLAVGSREAVLWGGVLWLVSAFLDRADGELARIGDMCSAAGHRYDYRVDVFVNSAFFVAAGVGLRHSWLGVAWAPGLGAATGVAMLICCWLSEVYEKLSGPGVRTWSGAWGFHPDDALYLLAPIAWLGWLAPILVVACVSTSAMAVVILARLLGLRRRLSRTVGSAAVFEG